MEENKKQEAKIINFDEWKKKKKNEELTRRILARGMDRGDEKARDKNHSDESDFKPVA